MSYTFLQAQKKRRRKGSSEERQHQRALLEIVQLRGNPGLLYWHTPNGGSRNKIEAANLKRDGVVSGVPDLFFLYLGRLYALEMKAPKGRVSPTQETFQAELTAQGIPVANCYSVDEAVSQLEAWDLLYVPRHRRRRLEESACT